MRIMILVHKLEHVEEGMIDWLVFNANFSSISAVSWLVEEEGIFCNIWDLEHWEEGIFCNIWNNIMFLLQVHLDI